MQVAKLPLRSRLDSRISSFYRCLCHRNPSCAQQTRANVIKDIKRTLRSGLAPDRIDRLLDRYRSNLAKKVIQAEIRGQLLGMPYEEKRSQLLEDASRRQQIEKMILVMNSFALSESFVYSFYVSPPAHSINRNSTNKNSMANGHGSLPVKRVSLSTLC